MHRSIVLDYDIRIKPLDEEDKVFQGGSLGNFRYKHAYLSQGRIHGVAGGGGWLEDEVPLSTFPPPSNPLHLHLSIFISVN